MPGDTPAITQLLRDWRAGDDKALEQLTGLVYHELHRLAGNQMRRERPEHTFSPTDLVSEAFLRLAGDQQHEFHDRVHFFAIAARHMRHILVEHARKRSAEKRGGGAQRVTLGDRLVTPERPEELLALDRALEALAAMDERKARVVELHYFGGLEQTEIAALLEVHKNTILRDLRLAEAWLNRYLESA